MIKQLLVFVLGALAISCQESTSQGQAETLDSPTAIDKTTALANHDQAIYIKDGWIRAPYIYYTKMEPIT